MVDYAKKNPGKLAFGSSGLGTSTQLRLEMLNLKAGIDILHVPYRGGADALTDVLRQQRADDERAELAAARQGGQADPAQRQPQPSATRISRTCRR